MNFENDMLVNMVDNTQLIMQIDNKIDIHIGPYFWIAQKRVVNFFETKYAYHFMIGVTSYSSIKLKSLRVSTGEVSFFVW